MNDLLLWLLVAVGFATLCGIVLALMDLCGQQPPRSY